MLLWSSRVPTTHMAVVVAVVAMVCMVCMQGVGVAAQLNINFEAWQMEKDGTLTFPERSLKHVMQRPNAGIAFTGGGTRSFLATIGYLAGLHEAGLLPNVRYVSGVSGGAWGTCAYMYASTAQGNDTQLLGPIMEPQHMTMKNLKHIDPECVRGGPVNKDFAWHAVENFFNPLVHGRDVWFKSVNDVYFKPYGVPDNKYPAASTETIQRIVDRNPALTVSDFALPRPNRPFWIAGISYIGPEKLSPFKESNRSYTITEGTPLYVGQPYTRDVTYTSSKGHTQTHTVGGYMDTFAFGSAAPSTGLTGANGTLHSTTIADRSLSPARIASMSSFAAGALLSDLPNFAARGLDPIFNTWSPSLPAPDTDAVEGLYGDGGNTENVHLIGLLQRRVPNIILFFNNMQALNSTFDPMQRNVTETDMTDDLPTFFGINPAAHDTPLWDIHRNQVFPKKDFARVIKGLTAAQVGGNGTFFRTELETVENKWYGVKAGFRANVTWVYLSRTLEWERRLPADLRKAVQPKHGADNPTNLPDSGHFKNFPNINTYLQLYPSAEMANMIADMCGWVVKNNVDAFKTALGMY
ncbi:hypothetical protein PTSG_06717 [Salpingoeca rosetta]|uniref:Uncharacterized protein n=1 Tax=Salpingoeca rosetta (strain ATCC 50818 / BSB-021) TaxID=946362 RepID=F2UEK9_SALR5|nr:uncharacterized protein PTSG_06717 [Salpingoeca rosetta]EGD75059.1 hypothetical protein PTSG_06717 [Salpingoeca rosetta]|eukprot:XP_004992112.1 hypothetical protein PTSG_06717 [Salpingoeca rosetta]